jgi:hypothetical protein
MSIEWPKIGDIISIVDIPYKGLMEVLDIDPVEDKNGNKKVFVRYLVDRPEFEDEDWWLLGLTRGRHLNFIINKSYKALQQFDQELEELLK